MSNDAVIQVRLDAKTKTRAVNFFKRFGLSTSDGVRLLLNQALTEKALPHIPNATTRKVLEDAKTGRGMTPTTIEGIQKMWDEA